MKTLQSCQLCEQNGSSLEEFVRDLAVESGTAETPLIAKFSDGKILKITPVSSEDYIFSLLEWCENNKTHTNL